MTVPADIQAAFDAVPMDLRGVVWDLRSLIFATADGLNIGPLSETLKWGQPSYAPIRKHTGTAVRIGLPKAGGIGLYVHCQTDIIGPLNLILPPDVTVDGNRGIIFAAPDSVHPEMAAALVRAAFTYYQ